MRMRIVHFPLDGSRMYVFMYTDSVFYSQPSSDRHSVQEQNLF